MNRAVLISPTLIVILTNTKFASSCSFDVSLA